MTSTLMYIGWLSFEVVQEPLMDEPGGTYSTLITIDLDSGPAPSDSVRQKSTTPLFSTDSALKPNYRFSEYSGPIRTNLMSDETLNKAGL
mmetsp:Transcript_8956/g.15185  ORF Transcript_8956/g.15185 Transcript_8956/m.15185 type:complete len:90 (+) Transcript_8956:381-650(+)